MTMTIGMISLEIFDSFAPEIDDDMNRHMPNGGVDRPIIMFSTITTPKCTRFTPRDEMIGSTSGTVGVKIARIDTLKIGTTSGSVKAWQPAEPGFTAKLNTVSGHVEYDLPLAKQGDAYVCGDGSGRVSIGTTSGNITVAELAEEER